MVSAGPFLPTSPTKLVAAAASHVFASDIFFNCCMAALTSALQHAPIILPTEPVRLETQKQAVQSKLDTSSQYVQLLLLTK
jgi:hypothetical protein